MQGTQLRPLEAGTVVPQITALLHKDHKDRTELDRRLVEHVFLTLKTIGPQARDAVPLLSEFQQHSNPGYRIAAMDAASKIAPDDETYRRIVAMITNDSSPHVVSAAGEALQSTYPERVSEVFAKLKARLSSGKPDQVMLASSAVYGTGPAAADLTSSLVACLKNPELPRAIVILALGKIGDAAHSAIPHLIDLMDDEDLQTSIFWSLGRIRARSDQAAEIERHIREALDKTRGSLPMGRAGMRFAGGEDRMRKRIYAFELLGKLANEHDFGAEILMESLGEPDSMVRWTLLWALVNLERHDEQIVPLLIDSLSDSSPIVQMTVLLGLGRLTQQPEFTVPLLMDYLHDPDPYLQSAAALSLASFPAYGKAAVDSLQELIDEESSSIQNDNRRQQAYWEVRRFPDHIEKLHTISVKEAAEIALAAIQNHTTQAGFQSDDDDE